MRTLRRSAPAVLLSALLVLAVSAAAAVPERSPRRAPAARAAAAAETVAVLSTVPVNVPQAALDARLHGTVVMRVRVSPLGIADSVHVVSGDPRLREEAVTSVRWWLFAPPPRRTWTTVAIDVDGREDADPLSPDVLEMARDAERRGAPWEAIEACVGALQRVGTHPRLRDPWVIRADAIRLARLSPGRLKVPGALMSSCLEMRGQQLRTMSRASHEEYVGTFDEALLVSPWWSDGYQWRAASLLLCGRGYDAMRTLMLFRQSAADSAARSTADRALAGLAAGDSLGVSRLLMHEGLQFNRDQDADH